MSALISHCGCNLHTALRDIVDTMSPMSSASCSPLHDGIISSNRITSLINEACASFRGPEHSKEFFWISSLEVSIPLWIVK
jgi:hypothetical protein